MGQPKIKSKIIRHALLDEVIKELRSQGKSIAFTNGCFDILHSGHVIYLEQASEKCDVLFLGLNSDESVKRQGKGDNRPVNDYNARATVVAALASVDFVVEFEEDTPIKLIEKIKPDVLIKGGDYDPEETNPGSQTYIVGRDIVLSGGGKVKVIPTVKGYSTTSIIKKLNK